MLEEDDSTLFNTTRTFKSSCENGAYAYGDETKCVGACDAISFEGYTKDYWVASNTCKEGASCTTAEETCEIKYQSYGYKLSDATKKCDIVDSTDKTTEEIKDANDIKTGDAMIYIVWTLGILSLGYMVYHIYRLKNNEI